ncbi:MAG: alpha-N-arabinofuranosidase [Bryobacter sp.]|nr:alpha-N-arabinofuranosidase [Bryobacter sp.]
MKTTRRVFLGAAAVLSARRTFAASENKQVTVHLDRAIGRIAPELHGHFAEHLGTCIYGGLWVGKGSKIPNIDGHRKQAVEDLKALGLPVLRWPGGCFADDYHWRDGIGPAKNRPKRVNIWWGNYTEDNSFGTHEFIELCRLIGAEPYIAANVGSGTPQEMREWMEYCNYPEGSSLSAERTANGSPGAFKVKYWGIGNENWGCGGQMKSAEYATLYRRYSTYAKSFGGTPMYRIACGPNSNDLNWTREFFENIGRPNWYPQGFAMHWYANQRTKADAFTPELMYKQFDRLTGMEQAIQEQRALMDKYDKDRRVGLIIDEWGVWDAEEIKYGKLWQQITMRGAIAAAQGLNIFHRQADKVVMGNIAQTVNVLQALVLTDGPRYVKTPVYYAYLLMKEHRGQQSVGVEGTEPGARGLSVSASRQENRATITLVNPRHDSGMSVRCTVSGGSARSAAAQMIQDNDLNAHNAFDAAERVFVKPLTAKVESGAVVVELPPLSVVTVNVGL